MSVKNEFTDTLVSLDDIDMLLIENQQTLVLHYFPIWLKQT